MGAAILNFSDGGLPLCTSGLELAHILLMPFVGFNCFYSAT